MDKFVLLIKKGIIEYAFIMKMRDEELKQQSHSKTNL